jgi:hypothetical protein
MQVIAEAFGSTSSKLLLVRFQIRIFEGLFCAFIVASCVCFFGNLVVLRGGDAVIYPYMHSEAGVEIWLYFMSDPKDSVSDPASVREF